jgi:hypothetical protein
MTATDTRRPAGARTAVPAAPPAPVPVAAPEVPAALVAALIRTVQAAAYALAGTVGRADGGPNSTLVRLGAAREDVETLRAFLAAQPGFRTEEDS